MKFNELLAEFPHFDAKIFLGGPVKTDNLYFIHTLGEQVPGSIRILDGLYWGGDIDVVKDMISSQKNHYSANQILPGLCWMGCQAIRARTRRIFLGY